MPKGFLPVATNCRYCKNPLAMKTGAKTHSAWMSREFSWCSYRIFVPFSFYKRQAVFPFYHCVPPNCETTPTVRAKDTLHLSGKTSRKMKTALFRRTSTKRMALTNGIRAVTALSCCLPMPCSSYIACLAVAQFHSHPNPFITVSRPLVIIFVFFIAVTKISCQKAPWLWRPTVTTAISHTAWRQERKHTRHECQER